MTFSKLDSILKSSSTKHASYSRPRKVGMSQKLNNVSGLVNHREQTAIIIAEMIYLGFIVGPSLYLPGGGVTLLRLAVHIVGNGVTFYGSTFRINETVLQVCPLLCCPK